MAPVETKGYIEINAEACKGCELCVSYCPHGSIAIQEELNTAGYFPAYSAKPEECTGCAICAVVCPDAAIGVYRA